MWVYWMPVQHAQVVGSGGRTGVVVHPGRYCVITQFEKTLDGSVEGVGAVEREDEVVGVLAVEECV